MNKEFSEDHRLMGYQSQNIAITIISTLQKRKKKKGRLISIELQRDILLSSMHNQHTSEDQCVHKKVKLTSYYYNDSSPVTHNIAILLETVDLTN